MADLEACGMIRYVRGYCGVVACARPLPPRRRAWCSNWCAGEWSRHHLWTSARHAAFKRDGGRCRRCGTVGREVNHITPRYGSGYQTGCHNHQDNLETLCRPCHLAVTRIQREARKSGGMMQIAMPLGE